MAQRVLVVTVPLALLAGGWAIFHVLKELPPADCGAQVPAGMVEDHRRGLGAYATFSALVIGSLIASISAARSTRLALAVCAWLAALYNVENAAFEVHATVAVGLTIFGGELLLACSAIAVFAMRRPRIAQLAYLWTALPLILPALVASPATRGGSFLCMS